MDITPSTRPHEAINNAETLVSLRAFVKTGADLTQWQQLADRELASLTHFAEEGEGRLQTSTSHLQTAQTDAERAQAEAEIAHIKNLLHQIDVGAGKLTAAKRQPISSAPIATEPVAPEPVAPIPLAPVPVLPIPAAPVPVAPIPVASVPVVPIPVARLPFVPSVTHAGSMDNAQISYRPLAVIAVALILLLVVGLVVSYLAAPSSQSTDTTAPAAAPALLTSPINNDAALETQYINESGLLVKDVNKNIVNITDESLRAGANPALMQDPAWKTRIDGYLIALQTDIDLIKKMKAPPRLATLDSTMQDMAGHLQTMVTSYRNGVNNLDNTQIALAINALGQVKADMLKMNIELQNLTPSK